MSVRVGVLLRHEDESGVSGTGIVADVFEYPDGWCVMHWRSNTPSTNIYPNTKAMTAVHSHGGKTEIVFYADLPSPRNEEELGELIVRLTTSGDEEKEREQLVERVAEQVAKRLKADMQDNIEEAAETEARKVMEGLSKKRARKAPTKGENG